MPIDLPPVTRNLLIANVVIFLLQKLAGDAMIIYFALWPLGPELAVQGGLRDLAGDHLRIPAWRPDPLVVQYAGVVDVWRRH